MALCFLPQALNPQKTREKRGLTTQNERGTVENKLGTSLTALARLPEGRKALLRAVKLSPPSFSPWIQFVIGNHYTECLRPQQAAMWYRRGIESTPNEATGYIFLGSILLRQGNHKEAEKCYSKATTCSKGCIDEAFLNLGFAQRALGLYPQALRSFRKALQLYGKCKEASQAIRDVSDVISYLRNNA